MPKGPYAEVVHLSTPDGPRYRIGYYDMLGAVDAWLAPQESPHFLDDAKHIRE